MGINIATKQFQTNVIKAVNECNLPPAVVRLVLEDILRQVISQEEDAIKAEFNRESTEQAAEKPGEE